MKILIVEDEPLAANNLLRQIKAVRSAAEILPIADTIRLAVDMLQAHQVDLLFLDIQLSDGLSFEIFQQHQVSCPIIFTTAFDEFAIQAFEHNSIAYLLKPITKEKVKKAFSKLEQMRQSLPLPDYASLWPQLVQQASSTSYQKRFLVKKGNKLLPFQSDQIAFFLSEDKCVFLVSMEGKRYIYQDSLNQLETILDPSVFFRLSRQYLVNRQSIQLLEAYNKGQVAVRLAHAKEKIVVSRKQTALLKEWLQQ